jgi:translation initiation factor IF-2
VADKVIVIANSITVGELADALHISVTKLIGELFKNGIMATINQRIDFETASIIVEELGIDAQLQQKEVVAPTILKEHVLSKGAVSRPPVIAMMGHVDHGKTSLLDAILGTKLASKEAGGITQYISAYQTSHKGKTITLLDTPGHEAFAALRQHGAMLTDVVVIVVAADDGVKPQTVEAIKFAQNANTKIVIAINKVDKETANVQLVKTQLATDFNLVPEEWGGDTVMVEVSAKTKKNIDKLLDMVLLVADIEDLKADIDIPAEGLVVEAHMEVGRGSVVSLLVEQGILTPGCFIVAGYSYGRIRTMLDFKGKALKQATPSTPVTVTGFKELPQFGDKFIIVKNEKEARNKAAQVKLEQERNVAVTNVTSSDLLKMMKKEDEAKEFSVIIKADVQGSLTSVVDSLKLLNTNKEVVVNIISSGVGNISEGDIRMANDGKTVIYGFNIDIPVAVKKLALRSNVKVRLYKVIYELLDDAKKSMEDLLPPKVTEVEIGKLSVKGIFRTTREYVIVGGEVTDGKMIPGSLARIKRGGDVISEAKIISVQREQQSVKEAVKGEMCGLSVSLDKKIQINEGDKIELFNRSVTKQSL